MFREFLHGGSFFWTSGFWEYFWSVRDIVRVANVGRIEFHTGDKDDISIYWWWCWHNRDKVDTYTPMMVVARLSLWLFIIIIIIVGEWVWGVREAGWKHEMKSHKSEVAITSLLFVHQPTRKQCRLSPEINTWTPAAVANKQPASAGTLGGKGRCRPNAQVLTP